MIRWFSLRLWLMLAVVVGAVVVLGRWQPVPPSLRQLKLMDCAPPCWIGIVPGQSTIAQAKAAIVAAYSGQPNLQIRDSGFADGPVAPHAVETRIDTDTLSLAVWLHYDQLIDGRSEIVQSINLFEQSSDHTQYLPTAADILGTFGPPPEVGLTVMTGYIDSVALLYPSWAAVASASGHVELDAPVRIYLGGEYTPPYLEGYQRLPWRGFAQAFVPLPPSTLAPSGP